MMSDKTHSDNVTAVKSKGKRTVSFIFALFGVATGLPLYSLTATIPYYNVVVFPGLMFDIFAMQLFGGALFLMSLLLVFYLYKVPATIRLWIGSFAVAGSLLIPSISLAVLPNGSHTAFSLSLISVFVMGLGAGIVASTYASLAGVLSPELIGMFVLGMSLTGIIATAWNMIMTSLFPDSITDPEIGPLMLGLFSALTISFQLFLSLPLYTVSYISYKNIFIYIQ
eukprot:GHVL01013748.1.p1 GENE.GHVL01013748.1~~GHVL01013748.1.p1  ORF type:complete len:225 (-),score=15.67 GHVL01013748.1:83-757(-)